MCEFCDDLKHRTYRVLQRTTSADDNQCEFGSPDPDVFGISTCYACDGCRDDNLRFELRCWDNYISIGYFHRIKSLCIEPFSESIAINYCPWCGKKLTDELVDFKKCHYGKELELMGV